MKYRPAPPMLDDAQLDAAIEAVRDDEKALTQLYHEQRQAAALRFDEEFTAFSQRRDDFFRRFNAKFY